MLSHYKLLVFIFIIITIHFCKQQDSSEYQIKLNKSIDNLNNEIEKLNNYYGVWPSSMKTNHSVDFQNNNQIIYKDPATWHEFFLFDRKRIIILLSHKTEVYLSLYDERFFTRMNKEYQQIKDNLVGSDKEISSATYFKSIGSDHRIEIYFTPKEFRFNTTFRMSQISNHRPRADLWRLIKSATTSSIYSPHFQEEQLFTDMSQDIKDGKNRLIVAKTHSDSMSNIKKTDVDLGFSLISGEGLEVTKDLLDKQDPNFVDKHELTQDFLALFSVPFGNAHEESTNNDILSNQDGIVVVIRGPIEPYKQFIREQGVDIYQNSVEDLFESFNLTYAYPTSKNQLIVNFTHPPLTEDINVPAHYCLVEITDPNNVPTDCTTSSVNIIQAQIHSQYPNQVVIDTADQNLTARYKFFINNIRRASDSKPLDLKSTNLKPAFKFLEVFNKSSVDAIEIFVKRPGSIEGVSIHQKNSFVYTFTNQDIFDRGDIIVFHSQAIGADDTKTNNHTTSTGYTSGYDFFFSNIPETTGKSITSTTSELELKAKQGYSEDYIAWSNEEPTETELKRLQTHMDNNNWLNIDDTNEVNIHDYVNANFLTTTTCLQRVYKNSTLKDTNSSEDWFTKTCSLGVLNSTEEPDPFTITNAFFSSLNQLTLVLNLTPRTSSSSNISNFTLSQNSVQANINTIQHSLGSRELNIVLAGNASSGTYVLSVNNLLSIENNSLLSTSRNVVFSNNTSVSHLVISEIGINLNSKSSCDYIEIFNPTSRPISLNGYSVQRSSKPSSTALGTISRIDLPNFTLPNNEYYLITDDDWNTNGCNAVVEPNSTGNLVINNDDSILLVQNINNATSCSDANIIDKVGFGSSGCFEGSTIQNLGSQDSIERKQNFNSTSDTLQNTDKNQGHSFDNNNNSIDFVVHDNYQDPQRNNNIPSLLGPVLSNILVSQVFTQNMSISTVEFTNTGGGSLTACTGNIPPGLNLSIKADQTTCVISGTPTAISTATEYTITATNATNSNSATINITIQDPNTGSSTLVISEVGNKFNDITANDYILIYNTSNSSIDLSNYYIGRDSSCNIGTGTWTEYDSLPSFTLSSGQYYLISRSGNTISADLIWDNSSSAGSLTSNYCIAIGNSSTKPTSATHSSVVDFVSFGSTTDLGEGNINAPTLSNEKVYRRKGTCFNEDTNHNRNDFEEITAPSSPKMSSSAICTP